MLVESSRLPHTIVTDLGRVADRSATAARQFESIWNQQLPSIFNEVTSKLPKNLINSLNTIKSTLLEAISSLPSQITEELVQVQDGLNDIIESDPALVRNKIVALNNKFQTLLTNPIISPLLINTDLEQLLNNSELDSISRLISNNLGIHATNSRVGNTLNLSIIKSVLQGSNANNSVAALSKVESLLATLPLNEVLGTGGLDGVVSIVTNLLKDPSNLFNNLVKVPQIKELATSITELLNPVLSSLTNLSNELNIDSLFNGVGASLSNLNNSFATLDFSNIGNLFSNVTTDFLGGFGLF